LLAEPRTGLVLDAVLDELAAEADRLPVEKASATTGAPAQPRSEEAEGYTGPDEILFHDAWLKPASTNLMPPGTGLQPQSEIPTIKLPVPQPNPTGQSEGVTVRLIDLVLAAGISGYGAGILTAKTPGAKSPKRTVQTYGSSEKRGRSAVTP